MAQNLDRVVFEMSGPKGLTVNGLIAQLLLIREQEPNGGKMGVYYDLGDGKRPVPIQQIIVGPMPLCKARTVPWIVSLI